MVLSNFKPGFFFFFHLMVFLALENFELLSAFIKLQLKEYNVMIRGSMYMDVFLKSSKPRTENSLKWKKKSRDNSNE